MRSGSTRERTLDLKSLWRVLEIPVFSKAGVSGVDGPVALNFKCPEQELDEGQIAAGDAKLEGRQPGASISQLNGSPGLDEIVDNVSVTTDERQQKRRRAIEGFRIEFSTSFSDQPGTLHVSAHS